MTRLIVGSGNRVAARIRYGISLNRFIIAAVSGFVVLAGTSSAAHVSAAGPTTVVVKMVDMPPSFDPERVTIHVGDTVKWENVGDDVHHATDDAGAAIKSDDVAHPTGAEAFDSGFMRPKASFTHTFTVPGTYKYVCVAHETSGMSGEVIVR